MILQTADRKRVLENPYIGPRPFRTEDRRSFFGRDHEARNLIPLVIAERLVLFYAESGAGKSSLINARLIPGLQERNFKILPVSRVSGQSTGNIEAENIFTYNLLLSLDTQVERDPQRLAHLTLSEYLEDLDIDLPPEAPNPSEIKISSNGTEPPTIFDAPQVVNGVYPIALVIDQFEEIFTANPGAWSQREPFFRQLSEAMEKDPYLWIILAMREDYVASLDPYLYLLPGNLQARFYMQRMSYESALEAVKKPAAQHDRPFEAGVAEDLVNNLRLLAVGPGQEGQPKYVVGQFIEPVQLQVVCYQLWEQLEKDGGTSITADDLKRLAKGKDLAQFISSALADFYNQAIVSVSEVFPHIRERKLRDLFSKELITEARTRGLVFKGEKMTGDLPNEVLNRLEGKFIIRTETRGASTWYEIVHDRFVDPILEANREWAESNPRLYQADADAWKLSGKDLKKLYDGRRLAEALKQVEANPDDFSPDEVEFIRASKEASDNTRTRRQRILAVLGAILVVAMAVLTVFAFRGQMVANELRAVADNQRLLAQTAQAKEAEQRVAAETAKAEAEKQRNAALDAQAKEAQQRQAAEAAKAEADKQRALADQQSQEALKQKAEAEKQRNAAEVSQKAAQEANLIAQASRLASLGDYFRGKKQDLSLLMAVGGITLSDNWETRQSLLNSLQMGLAFRLDQDGAPLFTDDQVYSLAYSADGEYLAVGLFNGQVKVISVVGHGTVATPPPTFKANGPVNSLSFSTRGDLLASGGDDGTVRIWKIGGSTLFSQFGPYEDRYIFPSIQSIAFQPGGDLLAISTVKDPTNQIGHVVLYDYLKKQRLTDVDCGSFNCTALAWSPDGVNLAFGSEKGVVQIWNSQSQKIIHNFGQAHNGSVKGLAWYPDGQRLVSGGLDKRMILWDTGAEKMLAESSPDKTPVILSLSLAANGRYLVVGSNDPDAFVTLWDGETLLPQSDRILRETHRQNVDAVAVSPKGDSFSTGSLDDTVHLWKYNPVSDLAHSIGFTLNNTDDNHGITIGLALNSAGQVIQAQKSTDTLVKVWTQGQKDALSLQASPNSANAGTLNGQMVFLFGASNGDVAIVDPGSGKQIDLKNMGASTVFSVAIGGDGKWLAAGICVTTGQPCNQLVLWDMSANTKVDLKTDLSKLGLGDITSLAFSIDGSVLAIGTSDSRILFYNLATGRLDQAVTEGLNLQGSSIAVTSLAYSPNEVGLVAAGFRDGRIALWQAGTWGPVGEFTTRMSSQVSGITFSKGNDNLWSLYSVNERGDVWEWQVERSAWIQKACQLAGRSLTPVEQTQFIPADSGFSADQICPNISQ